VCRGAADETAREKRTKQEGKKRTGGGEQNTGLAKRTGNDILGVYVKSGQRLACKNGNRGILSGWPENGAYLRGTGCPATKRTVEVASRR